MFLTNLFGLQNCLFEISTTNIGKVASRKFQEILMIIWFYSLSQRLKTEIFWDVWLFEDSLQSPKPTELSRSDICLESEKLHSIFCLSALQHIY